MKKILLLIAAAIAIVGVARAQFVLTPNGIANNTDKDYLVFEYGSKSQSELFTTVNMALNAMYVSPQDVLSIVKNNSITINGVATHIHRDKNMFSTLSTMTMNYTIVVEFKDGRIRIMNPTINKLIIPSNGTSTTSYDGLEWIAYLYNKKGVEKHPKTNESIEDHLNNIVLKITSSITEKENDNW